MAHWNFRENLSYKHKLRRSYYELLRDDFDQFILNYALIDSYDNFFKKQIPYPFVEKRELKPRAIIPNVEHECQNAFLVVLLEDSIPSVHKKYIRFFDMNKTTKINFIRAKMLSLSEKFDRTQKYIENVHFNDFIKDLLPVDYALLIQRDGATTARDRYAITHFHVRIDWPVADAAEDLAIKLRYISKHIYEKGDKYAEDVQKKFFEYYGLPFMVGGRRTAAVVASQYFSKLDFMATVYAASSESRALLKISERGVSKAILAKFNNEEMGQIAEANKITISYFKKNYVVLWEGKESICLFKVTYNYTSHARVPEDGKLRDINSDPYWLTVGEQHILPKPDAWIVSPLKYNMIYS